MVKKLLPKLMLLLCALIVGSSSVWADDQVTLWSEDFSSYSANAVPSGGTYNYSCGGANTKIYDADLAGGSAPELLLQKSSNGTLTATIPLDNIEGDLTLTFKTNNQKIKVETTTDGLTGSLEEKASGTHTVTFKGVTTSTTSITIKFTCSGSSNVRLDDIVLTGTKASGGGDTPTLSDCDLALTGAPVALNFDLYNNSTAQTIKYTTSSTGAVTIAESEYATFAIDAENKTITVTPTAVTPSAQTITVNQAADDNYKAGSATFTLTITDSTPIPTHKATFSVNGATLSTQDFEEGAAITFPDDPADVSGKTFVGWTATAIDGTTDEAPAFVTSATMDDEDVTFYAVFANVNNSGNALNKMQAGDTFTAGDKIVVVASTDDGLLGLYQETVSSSYVKNYSFQENYSNVVANDRNWWTVNSGSNGGWILGDATNGYLYNSGSNNLSVDMTNSSVWTLEDNNDDTFNLKSGRYLSCRTDLSGENVNRFRMAGSTPNGVYSFTIYKLSDGISYSDYCTTVVADTRLDSELSFADAEVEANIGVQFEAPTLNTATGFNGTVVYTSSDESVAQIMDQETGDLMLLKEGTTTITATFAGNEDFKAGSASYTLTVVDNRIATTITQENIVLDKAEYASLTQLNPVVTDANDNVIDYEFSEFLSIVSFEQVSEDDVIASIDGNTGAITLSGKVGTATIKAYYNRFNQSSTYKPSECTFTITVENVLSISEARAQGTGDVLTKGVVTSVSGKNAYIQDENAAILVYANSNITDLAVGDRIKVSGTLEDYYGLLEIKYPTYTVLSSDNTVTPEVMTIAEIKISEKQGWLVKIENARVTDISGQNTTIAQGENTIVVRGITGVEEGNVLTLTGNIGYYNAAQIANPTDVTIMTSATVTITDAGFATYCSESALDFSESGLTAYIAKLEGGKVKFYQVATVPANTGVLLKGDAGEHTIKAVTSSDTDVTDNKLIGVNEETEVDHSGIYVLMKVGDNVAFYMTEASSFTVGAHTAYIDVIPGNNARVISFEEGGTTAIDVRGKMEDVRGDFFNIAGQRVAKPAKGLYIVNGKKVVVK